MYRIEIDRSLCSGYGSCIDAAPELFELGPDGVAVSRVDATRAAEVLDAASACPMAAIAVRDVEEEDEQARGLAA